MPGDGSSSPGQVCTAGAGEVGIVLHSSYFSDLPHLHIHSTKSPEKLVGLSEETRKEESKCICSRHLLYSNLEPNNS